MAIAQELFAQRPDGPSLPPIGDTAKPKVGRRWFPWVATIVVVSVICGYFYVKFQPTAALATILTQPVERGEMVVTVTEDGSLESSSNLDLKCEVPGGSTVLWIIKDGSHVNAGDELVQLDSSTIEDQINVQLSTFEKAQATKIEMERSFEAAKIAVTEYQEGTFPKELQTAEGNITIAEENLRSAQNAFHHAERMARKGYVTALQRESLEFAVQRAQLELNVAKTAKMVLERFTKAKMLGDLQSKADTVQAQMRSAQASFDVEQSRLNRLRKNFEKCVIRAPRSGLIVYANDANRGGRGGQTSSNIEEGATVRERQSIIRMPDLEQMQVLVSIHESKIKDIEEGLRARIRVQDREFLGIVSSVANQAEQPNWFSPAVRKYPTIVKIEGMPADLLPGMTATCEILIADKKNILTLPVQSVVEQGADFRCWVQTSGGLEARTVELGQKSLSQIEVLSGINEGEMVVLDPRRHVPAARDEIHHAETIDVERRFGGAAERNASADVKKSNDDVAERRDADAEAFHKLDVNQDGQLSRDETPAQLASAFDGFDSNHDGHLDRREFAAARRCDDRQAGVKKQAAVVQ